MAKKPEIEAKKSKERNLVGTRGRVFQGNVIKKFQTRAVIEFTRTVYVTKYERYQKEKTKLHARIPINIDVQVGDLVKIQETRPLSKIIHFIIVENISKTKETKQ